MFAHLHVHTEYSLLDGMSRVSELPAYAKELGMSAIAITDHGQMFGIVDFYKSCLKNGIKPIIGCEVYVARRTLHDKEIDKDRYSGHLILLAENQTGYKNLVKLVSKSYVDGFYFKPRVDKNELRKHSDGLICLSGCLAGNIAHYLSEANYDAAKKEAVEMREIFGKDNFFLEIQNHHLEADPPVISGLKALSQETGIPLCATNDAHYIRREDAEAQDILMCIQTQASVTDENRMRFENDQFYIKSEEEMRELFPDIPEAIEITQKIADRCNVEFEFGNYHLPEYEAPEGYTCSEYLRKLCMDGLAVRYGEIADDPRSECRIRLENELSVIENMGYVEYFLIVWDFIDFAKKNGIMVGPGRGSAAGSIVAYSLAITEIDPLKYNLIFERFLNPERVSMPDIDVDFCIERRQEVIDYVVEKYGKDKVSQIITLGTLKAKAAIRDVARALNASYAEGDSIAREIPNELNMTIKKALEINPELRQRYANEPLVKKVIDTSIAVEGLPRHASTHAAGVVISKMPLDEYVPLYSSDKGISTQFNMTTIEELGLLKMDFLGLRNLTVIRNAIRLIKQNHGVEIDFSNMEYDDPAVFRMISEGNTMGVFQLESAGMTDFMKNLKPSCFEDIIAGIALYRPGPMDSIPKYIENKKHPESITYSDPHLKPILNVTYGCLIYQEQVMQIVRELGGYSFGRSDLVRRAMSKKKMDVMLEEKEYFVNGKNNSDGSTEISGCISNGISRKAAETIFDDMVSFASYAFNKSHAAAYAVISYETAYLKCYYPVEFMAALLTSVEGDVKHTAGYFRNCLNMGIEVLPPSVLKSDRDFSVEDGKIRFGLLSVKNVGTGIVDAIIKGRDDVRNTEDFYSVIDSIEPSELNKKAIESLIRSGAFDSVNDNRAALIAVSDEAVKRAQNKSRANKSQISIFDIEGVEDDISATHELPNLKNFEKKEILEMEKEMLGVYVSGHPLDEFRHLIQLDTNVTTADLQHSGDEFENNTDDSSGVVVERSRYADGDRVNMAGMITGVRKIITKRGEEMARITLEDFEGIVNLIAFPKIYRTNKDILTSDSIIALSGRVSERDESDAEVLIDKVLPISRISELNQKRGNYENKNKETYPMQKSETELLLKVREDKIDEHGGLKSLMVHLSDLFSVYPGETRIIIETPKKRFKVDSSYSVEADREFIEKLNRMLGKENVELYG